MASTQRNLAADSDRLRCATGGEWKNRDQFSQSQLEKYAKNVRQGYTTSARSGISCKEHTSQGIQELRCQGGCGRRRELKYFSKSTRRKGTNHCNECTDHYQKLEVGSVLPAPNAQRSLEETTGELSPWPTLSNRTITHPDEEEAESAYSGDDDTSDLTSTMARTELRGSTADTLTDGTSNSAYQSTGDPVLDKHIPPHLWGAVRGEGPAPHWLLPRMDGPLDITETSGSSTVSIDTTSGVTDGVQSQAPAAQGIPFNAWGPSGEFARRVKAPTVASSSAYTKTTTKTEKQEPVRVAKTGWARPPTRKYEPQLPDYLKDEQQALEGVPYSDGSDDEL